MDIGGTVVNGKKKQVREVYTSLCYSHILESGDFPYPMRPIRKKMTPNPIQASMISEKTYPPRVRL